MSREILFRGKLPRSGDWLYGVPLKEKSGKVIFYSQDESGYVDPATVGQYTPTKTAREYSREILWCISLIRTNYFRVKDEESFRNLMARVYGCEDTVDFWPAKDKDGNTVFGFGCYGGISGVRNAEEDEDGDVEETSYDEFLDGLQKCVAEDDAIIILESGNEKLRYVTGYATIITSKDIQTLDLTTMAKETAATMLNNPESEWTTVCEY